MGRIRASVSHRTPLEGVYATATAKGDTRVYGTLSIIRASSALRGDAHPNRL